MKIVVKNHNFGVTFCTEVWTLLKNGIKHKIKFLYLKKCKRIFQQKKITFFYKGGQIISF